MRKQQHADWLPIALLAIGLSGGGCGRDGDFGEGAARTFIDEVHRGEGLSGGTLLDQRAARIIYPDAEMAYFEPDSFSLDTVLAGDTARWIVHGDARVSSREVLWASVQ